MIPQFDLLRQYNPRDTDLMLDEANTLYKMGNAPRGRALLQQLLFIPHVNDAIALRATNLWNEYDPAPLDENGIAAVGAKGSAAVKKAVARFYLARNEGAHARAALGAMAGDDAGALIAQADIAGGAVQPGLDRVVPILQKDQTHCDALLAKGQGTLVQRRYNDSVIASQSASADCPQMSAAYVTLARAQEASGNLAAANIAFKAGFDHNVQDSRLARTYTDWLLQKGNGTRAIAVARRVTRSAPALVSGWKLYLDLCNGIPDAGCTDDAEEGLSKAKQIFAIDLRSDELPPVGLFTRLEQQ